jgi:hypothetical protein
VKELFGEHWRPEKVHAAYENFRPGEQHVNARRGSRPEVFVELIACHVGNGRIIGCAELPASQAVNAGS